MKQVLTRVVFSLAALAFVSVATPALADTNIGVVNLQKIMRDSKAATAVRSQLQAKQKAFQADLDAKEKDLYAQEQALAKEEPTVTDKAAFQAKVTDFKNKEAAAQKEIAEKKASIDKAFGGALESIQTNVFAVVKDVAAAHHMNVVVSGAQVLYADQSLDVTDEVLQKLDARLPTVQVKFQ